MPVAQSIGFRDALRKFGFTQRDNLTSDDVTRRFYSLEVRMKNAEATEKRLLEHLTKSNATKDTLELEKEINRVRENIEQMKGQLRYWQAMSALATVHLTLTEDREFEPESAPTFGERIGSTWTASLENLQSFGEALVIVCVALVPWLPFLLLIAVPIWWGIRRSRRARDLESSSSI